MGQRHLTKTRSKIKQEIIQTKVDHPIIIILLGTGEVGKSTIFKRIENLFSNQHPKYFPRNINCKYDVLLHFKSVLNEFNNYRPTYDDKTEQILDSILHFDGDVFKTDSIWTNEVADIICEISKEEKFQNILSARHRNDIGDSAEYMIKKAKYFNSESNTMMDELRFGFLFDLNHFRSYRKTTGVPTFQFVYKGQEFTIIDTGGQRNERKKWNTLFEKQNVSALIHVCALSQYNEEMYEAFDNKVHDQLELLNKLFNEPNYVKQLTKLEEITDLPFYLLFNKRDVFIEEIQKEDIGICFPDCPNELRYDKNIFLMSPRVAKKPLQKLNSFELIKKPPKDSKVQDLSEDELMHILSFLGSRDLCKTSKVSSVFYYISNLNNLWMDLCLRYDPDITMDQVKYYYDPKSSFNMWKHYFVHCKSMVENSEKYLIDKFVSVTNKKFRSMHVTCAIEESFDDVIYSILHDILCVEKTKQYKKNHEIKKF
jgi:GTPase SAR1 family protein